MRATILKRIIAFFLDLLFCWGVLFYLWNSDFIQGIYHGYGLLFSQFEGLAGTVNGVDFISSLLTFWTIFIFVKLIVTFFFGLSLGALACGLSSPADLLKKRIQGSARVFLEFVLSPFLIFDMNLLFGKRTLKEKLTKTQIVNGQGTGTWIIALCFLLFIPLSFSLFFKSQSYSHMMKRSVFQTVSNEKITVENSKKVLTPFRNDFFRLESSYVSGQDFVLPSIYIKRTIDGKKKMAPQVYFIDGKNTGYSLLRRNYDLNLIKILKGALKGNPLFGLYYPHISKAFSDPTLYSSQSFVQKSNDSHLFSNELRHEIKEILSSSLNLYSYGPMELLSFVGPFPFGHHNLHTEVKKIFPNGNQELYDFVKIGDHEFLRKSIFASHPDGESEILKSFFFPIDTNNGSVYEWTFYPEKKASSSELMAKRDQFFSRYLINSKWWFDYSPPPRQVNNFFKFDPFSAADLIFKEDLDVFTTRKMEEFLYSHYFQSIKTLLSENNEKKIFRVQQALLELIYFMKIKNQKENKQYSAQFVEMFNYLFLHLKNKNLKFFGVS